jgi:hypothetical protein
LQRQLPYRSGNRSTEGLASEHPYPTRYYNSKVCENAEVVFQRANQSVLEDVKSKYKIFLFRARTLQTFKDQSQ